tara:strand:- start:1628 stop:1957 length:330 start_codon:yes stop_codon:yes gene_type:complete
MNFNNWINSDYQETSTGHLKQIIKNKLNNNINGKFSNGNTILHQNGYILVNDTWERLICIYSNIETCYKYGGNPYIKNKINKSFYDLINDIPEKYIRQNIINIHNKYYK